jgi:hypothetical protein
MDPERVQASLRQIAKIYGKILEDDSKSIVIPNAVESVRVTREKYEYEKQNVPRGMKPGSWGYTIDHSQPLRFTRSKVRDIDLIVDVYCDVQWKDDDIPVKQDIKVRIWSKHDATIYREEVDSPQILEQLTEANRVHPGRVVSRFHFDRVFREADSEEVEFDSSPEYHLQVGGKAESYELCWHPKKVNVPRLMHQPMELFLTCQMIAANFFWDEYEEIRKKAEWRRELIQYQKMILVPHYRKCMDILNQNSSLLDSLMVN